jgi:hypothetical protein
MSGRNLTAAPAEKPAIPKNFDLSRYPKFTESFTCLKHLKTKKKRHSESYKHYTHFQSKLQSPSCFPAFLVLFMLGV